MYWPLSSVESYTRIVTNAVLGSMLVEYTPSLHNAFKDVDRLGWLAGT